MPFACASVIGKMTRSPQVFVRAKYHLDIITIWPCRPACDFGTDARRAVGSMATLPSAAIDPDLKVKDEMWPSPTARRLR